VNFAILFFDTINFFLVIGAPEVSINRPASDLVGFAALNLALFVYFPPRIFYLAEAADPRRTWLALALVSMPFIAGVLFGRISP